MWLMGRWDVNSLAICIVCLHCQHAQWRQESKDKDNQCAGFVWHISAQGDNYYWSSN